MGKLWGCEMSGFDGIEGKAHALGGREDMLCGAQCLQGLALIMVDKLSSRAEAVMGRIWAEPSKWCPDAN